MHYGSNRYRYGSGDTPETADAEFAGRVEYVGLEPAFGSGYVTATQVVGLTVTDVRRGSGISVGDYADVDVAVVPGGRHVVPGSTNPDVLALDASMIQVGVTLVAWANLGADGRWQAIDVSTDGPVPSSNYAGRSRGRGGYAYGRPYSTGLEAALDLTDFPTNVFVIIPDAQTPTVPRQIRQRDHDALQHGWNRMMKGQGLTIDGPTVTVNGIDRNLAQNFRELLRGGLADSPMIRSLFLEIVSDDTHHLTIHVVHNAVGIFVDAFQFDPHADPAAWPHRGHHTIDIDDFDPMPRVSGNPRNDMMLSLQNLVHALREARQGLLFAGDPKDAYDPSHLRAMADENVFRREQGQGGALLIGATPGQSAPVITVVGNGHVDVRWEFRNNNGTGPLVVAETWDEFTDTDGKRHLASIDYFPA